MFIGIIHVQNENNDKALDYFKETVETYKSCFDETKLALMLREMGKFYCGKDLPEEAIECFLSAHEMNDRLLKGPNLSAIDESDYKINNAMIDEYLGCIYNSQGKQEKALACHRKALSTWLDHAHMKSMMMPTMLHSVTSTLANATLKGTTTRSSEKLQYGHRKN